MTSEDANIVKRKYADLHATLEAYEQTVFTRWASTIVDDSEQNLNKPLLVRENSLLRVNFDPKVVALLREVRYFEALSVAPPPTAAEIYSKAEVFRKFIFSLDHIAQMYNNIRTGVLDVERPLIDSKIHTIDDQINVALTSLNWKSPDIDSYISEISASVGDLSNTLQGMKNNVAQITRLMKNWALTPLIDRKDGKKLLNLEEKDAKLAVAYETIKRDGQTIHSLVSATRDLLDVDEESERWGRYREYVDGLVKEGFLGCIKTSLEYLVVNMEQGRGNEGAGALMEAKLELDSEMLVFTPAMEEGEGSSSLFCFVFVSVCWEECNLMWFFLRRQNPSEV